MSYNIVSLEDVVEKYDGLLIDLWGVVYDGYAPYENAINFMNKISSKKKAVTFLSNSPRPADFSRKMLSDWGINFDKINIYTSGDAVREQLTLWNDEVFSKLGRKFFHLSETRNTDLLSGLNVDRTDNLAEANFLLISAYLDDDENIDSFDYILEEAANLKLPAICANPDITVQHGPQLRYTAGTIAKRYSDLGGTVSYYGKPYSNVYMHLIKSYQEKGISIDKILMIGDTLTTDIKGANNVGIDSALVLTGNGRVIRDKIKANEINIFPDASQTPTWITHGMVKTY